MVRIKQAIVVEGRYDKNTLKQLVDAPVFSVGGFGVMHDRELLELLRKIAKKRGLIILTDPDGAGFVIRNYLKGALPRQGVLHAYIPDIYGKEARKKKPGKEGKLGVEAMSREVLLESLRRAGAEIEGEAAVCRAQPITKADMVQLGLSGGSGASRKRSQLLSHLQLPQHMSANALLETLNILYERQEFMTFYQSFEEET